MKLHLLKKARRFFKAHSVRLALLVLIGSFIATVLLFYAWYFAYPRHSAAETMEYAKQGIILELRASQAKGDEVARIPAVIQAIARQDKVALSELLPVERDKRGLSLMKATDNSGAVITRTQNTTALGDNAFINTAIGRKMSETGRSSASPESSSIDPRQVVLTSGRFVYQNTKRVGALFCSYLVDDKFAKRFADEHLPADAKILFYTKEYGLAGTNISLPLGREMVERYIRPELDIFQKDGARRFIRLSDGRFYLVQNAWLMGAESSTSGMLVFTPLKHLFAIAIIGFLLPLLGFFLVLYIKHRQHRFLERSTWCCPILGMIIIAYVVSCAALVAIVMGFLPSFKTQPYPLYNSVLRLQPEGGVFDSRFAQRISVVLDSGGEAINAIRLSLSYDPAALNIQSVDMDRSICEHFILSEHNSQTGTIEMECIIPNPGFKGNSAIVADLFFKAQPGTTMTSIHFLDDSEVLANDGLATNVLRLAIDSTLRFDDGDALVRQDSLVVFSPTHPNPERWYSKRQVYLSWAPNLPASVSVVNDPAHVFAVTNMSPLRSIMLNDGIHTFLVKGINNQGQEVSGTTVVRIDTTPPEQLELSASETRIKPGGLVRFNAAGSDAESGLQRVFYLRINNEIFFPIGNEIHVPFPQAGTYTVTLRAYDKAGNYREVSKKIIVRRYQ